MRICSCIPGPSHILLISSNCTSVIAPVHVAPAPMHVCVSAKHTSFVSLHVPSHLYAFALNLVSKQSISVAPTAIVVPVLEISSNSAWVPPAFLNVATVSGSHFAVIAFTCFCVGTPAHSHVWPISDMSAASLMYPPMPHALPAVVPAPHLPS